MRTIETYPNLLLALCIWREARGETREGKIAVKHVILNRVAKPAGPFAKCKDITTNILCAYQFSSFNQNDANAGKLPRPDQAGEWASWEECCDVVDSKTTDPTGGADHYFVAGTAIPKWAHESKLTKIIGSHKFYKIY